MSPFTSNNDLNFPGLVIQKAVLVTETRSTEQVGGAQPGASFAQHLLLITKPLPFGDLKRHEQRTSEPRPVGFVYPSVDCLTSSSHKSTSKGDETALQAPLGQC